MIKKLLVGLLLVVIANPAYCLVRVSESAEEQTVQGIFTTWVYLENKEDIPGIETDAEVTLDSKLLLREHHVKSIQVDWAYPQKSPYQIVLLAINGANPSLCEAEFRIVDLSVKGKPIITDKFGNCASESVVSEKNGNILIQLPRYTNRPKVSYEYSTKGGLKKLK